LVGVGLAAASVAVATASPGREARIHCPAIYWRTLRDRAQVCPPRHSLLADEALTGLRWSMWSAAGARGVGNLSCTDSGCTVDVLAHAQIRLSRVRRCPDGARIFTRFDAYFTDQQEPVGSQYGWRIPCNGATGGGNG